MNDLLSMDQSDMEEFVVRLGFPKYRGRQLYEWCHHRAVFDFDAMSNLPKDLIAALKEQAAVKRGEQVDVVASVDGPAVKFLLRFDDVYIETVLMRYDPKNSRRRNTLCVSTQAGCAMGCKFCATAQSGFTRNLTAGEIVDQVNFANAYLVARGEGNVTNVVYMGMGEPLANLDNVLKSIAILNRAKEIGMRRITVSTCGLVPEIKRLAGLKLQLTLAVSLHSADDVLRAKLMPMAKRYPLKELFSALDHYIAATGRRVTIEYALFEGVNDDEAAAKALASLLKHKLFHVNLIPGNPVSATGLGGSGKERINAFLDVLTKNNVEANVRESMGSDIDGACGQLRAKHENS